MVFFIGTVAVVLIIIIFSIKNTFDKKQKEKIIRGKILSYLNGKKFVSLIELIEHVNVIPGKCLLVLRELKEQELIIEKAGKVKLSAFGEKAYEKIIKDE